MCSPWFVDCSLTSGKLSLQLQQLLIICPKQKLNFISYILKMLQAENKSQISEFTSIKALLSAINMCLNLHFPLKFHFTAAQQSFAFYLQLTCLNQSVITHSGPLRVSLQTIMHTTLEKTSCICQFSLLHIDLSKYIIQQGRRIEVSFRRGTVMRQQLLNISHQ